VTAFYRRAFAGDILGPIFVDIAQMDLPAHLPVICDFSETVLLRAGLYHRNALRPHLHLNTKIALTPAHFARWLDLWTTTVDRRHTSENAELAKVQATRIASSTTRRLRVQQPRSSSPSTDHHRTRDSHRPAPGDDGYPAASPRGHVAHHRHQAGADGVIVGRCTSLGNLFRATLARGRGVPRASRCRFPQTCAIWDTRTTRATAIAGWEVVCLN
jgi:hemoglobin